MYSERVGSLLEAKGKWGLVKDLRLGWRVEQGDDDAAHA